MCHEGLAGRKAKEKHQKTPACCLGCRWWKRLSVTSASRIKACHLYLETGVRHGRHGDICSTWEPREETK